MPIEPRTIFIGAFAFVAILSNAGGAQSTHASDTTRFTYLFSRPAGEMKVWQEGDETVSELQYNDRGRGPHLVERLTTSPNGLITRLAIRGHDYLKDTVDERFGYADGVASWKNTVEGESSAQRPPQFYVSINSTPFEIEILARAMLNAGAHPLGLFPSGEATIEKVRDLDVAGGSASKQTVGLYMVTGLSFSPFYFWLDKDKHFFATVSNWNNVVLQGWETAVPSMLAAQLEASTERFHALAKTLGHRAASGTLVFRNTHLFDAEHATMTPHMTVVISGNTIKAVGKDGSVAIPAGAEIVDAGGKSLLPGLWDMHVHAQPGEDGMLHIGAGVTSARDMGNDTTNVLRLKNEFEAGSLIGPRLVLAGLIDSPGPFQVPIGVLANNETEVRSAVNRYADLGFQQIKVYSSMKPGLVPVIIETAHKRGLRVSGHVPAYMTAEQVVKLGFDEVQHVNFLMLNFIDSVKDTRSMSRFTAVGSDGALLNFSSQRFRSFLQLLKTRHTVIDPTVGTFEDMFVGRPGKISSSYSMVADRFPAQVRRGLFGGGLPVPPGMDQRYRDSYAAMIKMVGELYRAGIPIVAGTDALPGFGLHRELELYVRAGIPPAQALRIATLGAAQVMKLGNKLGSIAPGKLADVILVRGNPAVNISDIRNVETVVKNGVMYRSAEIYAQLGIKP